MNNLRGYLLKQKSTASPFGDTNKRWFEIESSSTTKHEIILSYYKRPAPLSTATKNASRRGFIFISDIKRVEEDAVCQWITIYHPRRTFRLQALDRKDHRKWFEELSRLVKKNGGGQPEQLPDDDVDGSVNIKDTPNSSSGSSTIVSTTIHKLPRSTGIDDDANQSKASIEIDFLRRINQSTDDSKSPKKRQSTTTPNDRQISKRDKPLANRVGHAIKKGSESARSNSPGEGGPVAHDATSAISSPANVKPDKHDDQGESPLWQRHKNRMLLLDESSSDSDCSSNESPPRNDSLLTNKSFADLEDLVSPTGLDTFISKTNRSSVVGNDARDAEPSGEDSFGGVW